MAGNLTMTEFVRMSECMLAGYSFYAVVRRIDGGHVTLDVLQGSCP